MFRRSSSAASSSSSLPSTPKSSRTSKSSKSNPPNNIKKEDNPFTLARRISSTSAAISSPTAPVSPFSDVNSPASVPSPSLPGKRQKIWQFFSAKSSSSSPSSSMEFESNNISASSPKMKLPEWGALIQRDGKRAEWQRELLVEKMVEKKTAVDSDAMFLFGCFAPKYQAIFQENRGPGMGSLPRSMMNWGNGWCVTDLFGGCGAAVAVKQSSWGDKEKRESNFQLMSRWVTDNCAFDDDACCLNALARLSVETRGVVLKMYSAGKCWKDCGDRKIVGELVNGQVAWDVKGLIAEIKESKDSRKDWRFVVLEDVDGLLGELGKGGQIGALLRGLRTGVPLSDKEQKLALMNWLEREMSRSENKMDGLKRKCKEDVGSMLLAAVSKIDGEGVVARIKVGVFRALWKMHVLFMSCNGYYPEKAAELIKYDVAKLNFVRFCGDEEKEKTKKNKIVKSRQWWSIWELWFVLDQATILGDSAQAYSVLHAASELLLQNDENNGNEDDDDLSLIASTAALLVMRGVNLLEREGQYEEAGHYMQIVTKCERLKGHSVYSQAMHRLVMDLTHRGNNNEALEVAEKALKEEGEEGAGVRGAARLSLEKIVTRLAVPPRRWKKQIFPCRLEAPILQIQVVRAVNASVESMALDWLLSREEHAGFSGLHLENSIFHAMFVLLMWDAIFAKGGSGNDCGLYQDAPADLIDGRVGKFRERRKTIVDRLLKEVQECEKPSDLIRASWDEHCGQVCIGFHWERLSLPELMQIADGFGPRVLFTICNNLASDYQTWRHGAPDLLLWKKQEGSILPVAKLVEVKGPGDQLSGIQTLWIDALLSAKADVAVARVSYV